jgi:hypothetical protein
MDKWLTVQFIGGPLDGEGQVHPTMNYRLRVPENPNGIYVFNEFAGSYVWVLKDDGKSTDN